MQLENASRLGAAETLRDYVHAVAELLGSTPRVQAAWFCLCRPSQAAQWIYQITFHPAVHVDETLDFDWSQIAPLSTACQMQEPTILDLPQFGEDAAVLLPVSTTTGSSAAFLLQLTTDKATARTIAAELQSSLAATASTLRRILHAQNARYSEELYRSLVEEAGDVLIYLSPDLRILEWNHEAEVLFGRDSDEVLNSAFLDICIADDSNRSKVNNLANSVLAGEPIGTIEAPGETRDGGPLFVSWRFTRLVGLRDFPFGIVAAGRDIAEQRSAQEALRTQVHRLQILRNVQATFHSITTVSAVVEHVNRDLPAQLGIDRATLAVYDPATKSLTTNSGFVSTHQPIGASISGLALERQMPVVENNCPESSIIPPGVVTQLGLRSSVALPILGAHGPLGVLRLDDTQRTGRFTEEELPFLKLVAEQIGPVIETALLFSERLQAEQALHGERNFMHAVFDNASSLMVVVDAESRIVQFNHASEKVSGYTATEVYGKLLGDLLVAPDCSAATQSLLSDDQVTGTATHLENAWLSKDGQRHLISWAVALLRDENDRVTHTVAIGTDITQQREKDAQEDLLNRLSLRLAATESVHDLGEVAREFLQEAFQWDAFFLAIRRSGKGRLSDVEEWDTVDGELVEMVGSINFVATPMLLEGPLGPGTTLLINRTPQALPERTVRFGDQSRLSASLMFAPVRAGTEILGVCSVQSYEHGRYTETDEAYLLKICDVIGPTLLRCRVQQESKVLLTLGSRLNVSRSTEEMARTILDSADQMVGFDSAFIHLVTNDDMQAGAIINIDEVDGIRQEVPGGIASAMTRKTMEQGPQLILRTPGEKPIGLFSFGDKSRPSGSLIFVPIRSAGKPVGVLSVQSYQYDAYTENDIPRLQALADFCGGTLERTRGEEQFRSREQRYRAAIEGSGAVPYQKDYQHNSFVFVGEGIEQITGYSAEEFDQHAWRELVQEAVMHGDASGLDKDTAIEKTRHGELQTWRADIRIKTRSGEEKWLFDSSVQLLDDSGKPVGSLGILQDITDRKHAEVRLKRSEEHFNQFMSNVPALAFIKDCDGRYLYVNNAWKNLFGIHGDDWRGRTDKEILPHFSGPYVENDKEVLRTGEPMEFVESAPIDGEMRFALVNKFLLPGLDGTPMLGGFAVDITERRRAEEGLRDSEERYALAVQGSNDGLWDWDLRTNTMHYSPRWKSILGLLDEQLTNSPEEWLQRVHFNDSLHVRTSLDDYLASGGLHFTSEHRLLHRDGVYRWALLRGFALRGTGGQAYRMAGSLTDISATKAAEEQLKHGAYHDTLTALPNRKLFSETLDRAVARSKRRADYMFAVLFLDLDRFKVINDSLGHLAGDQLLVGIARRLEVCVRPGDIVARLGGDEFTVLLDDIGDESGATRVANRILAELGKPLDLDGREVYTTASIGIALSTSGYQRAEDVLRDSDIAMYRAKDRGKARYEMFDTAMHASALEVLRLETDLRRAVEHQRDFFLVYQPVVDLKDGRVHGFEALVRWRHPERGIIPPAEFIPMLEETNLILLLGDWVMREALRQLSFWQHQNPMDPPLSMAINVSSAQFRQAGFVQKVAAMLSEADVLPNTVALELTESELMSNAEALLDVLAGLKALGLELHVDDFGTGYSSLAYLHRFPIDALKIDRLFVSHIGSLDESSEIVRAICTLGHSMKQQVIAEGIEKRHHLEALQEIGCNFGQGYLFSKPVPAEEASLLVHAPLPKN